MEHLNAQLYSQMSHSLLYYMTDDVSSRIMSREGSCDDYAAYGMKQIDAARQGQGQACLSQTEHS